MGGSHPRRKRIRPFRGLRRFACLGATAQFQTSRERIPVFVRFSTVAGSRGPAATVRDVRGFASLTPDGRATPQDPGGPVRT
ncbi:catalase [Amycolatopsis panacis]|uniref:catalase n=1 Tax=Amycolatopsis panacis TaxID=2340917 RepID=UPI002D7A0126|nr:catalase [Amycolatopsis panacis]